MNRKNKEIDLKSRDLKGFSSENAGFLEKLNYKNKSLKYVIKGILEEEKLELVMHFPHSSLDVPESFWNDVDITKDYFNKINLKMSDVLLLDLFSDWDFKKIIASYSRLYVDVEKYWDEEKESMSRYGMGAIYTKDLYGNKLHKKTSTFVKEAKSYYERYHEELSKACNSENDILLLDIHSFNKEIVSIFSKSSSLPDICIGVNNDHSYNKGIVDRIIKWCNANNISYALNYPYSGAMYPNKTNKKNKIYSIMLEFNKSFYL